MLRRYVKLLVFFFIIGCILDCGAEEGKWVGKKAPELTIEKFLNGTPPKNKENNIKLIEFWATWCPPCRKSIPHMNEIAEELKKENIVIIGITADPEKTVKNFMKNHQFKYYVALDKNFATVKAFKIKFIPYAFIIDNKGIVVWEGFPMELSVDKIKKFLPKKNKKDKEEGKKKDTDKKSDK